MKNRCCCGCQEGRRHKTNLEMILFSALSAKFGDVVVAPFSTSNRWGYIFDIAIPKYMIDIECDGDMWHKALKRKRHDNLRDSYFKARGWTTLRFTTSQILNDVEGCVKSVNEVLKVIKNERRRRIQD